MGELMKPWDKCRNETARQYKAFLVFRDLGSARSVKEIAEVIGESEDNINTWSGKFNWIYRAEQYDKFVEQENAIHEMLQRHINISLAFQQKAAARLKNINPDELNPRDCAYWIDAAIKLELQSRNEIEKRKKNN